MKIDTKASKIKKEINNLVDSYTQGMCTADELALFVALKVKYAFEASPVIKRREVSNKRLQRIMAVRAILDGREA